MSRAKAIICIVFSLAVHAFGNAEVGITSIRMGERLVTPDSAGDIQFQSSLRSTASASEVGEFPPPIEASSEFLVYEESFSKIVKGSKIELLTRTNSHEGPVYVKDGNYFLWTTVPRLTCERTFKCFYSYTHIMKYDIDTGVETTFRNHSNMANGQYLDRKGRLLTCEQGAQWERPEEVNAKATISRTDLKTGKREVLVDNYFGHKFNSPNDVVEKSDGTIWFTDPSYGYLQGFREKPCLGQYVYRLDPNNKKISIVVDDLMEPNGLAFSPDEKVMYITDTAAFMSPLEGLRPDRPRHILAYDVIDGRFLANKRLFAVVAPGIPDGIKVDVDGNVYTCAEDGVHVFNKYGDLIGKILVRGSVNLYFGGPDQNILYITADTHIVHVRLNIRGVSPV